MNLKKLSLLIVIVSALNINGLCLAMEKGKPPMTEEEKRLAEEAKRQIDFRTAITNDDSAAVQEYLNHYLQRYHRAPNAIQSSATAYSIISALQSYRRFALAQSQFAIAEEISDTISMIYNEAGLIEEELK